MKLNLGDCPALPAAIVAVAPVLSKRVCVLSNTNLKINFGPDARSFQTVSGKLQVGHTVVLPVVVVVAVLGGGSSSFFLQENKTTEIRHKARSFFIFCYFYIGQPTIV